MLSKTRTKKQTNKERHVNWYFFEKEESQKYQLVRILFLIKTNLLRYMNDHKYFILMDIKYNDDNIW